MIDRLGEQLLHQACRQAQQWPELGAVLLRRAGHSLVSVCLGHPDAVGNWRLRRTLRAVKAQASLTVAIADIANVWPVEKVTAALSMLADRAVALSVAHLLKAAVARGEIDHRDRAPVEAPARHRRGARRRRG